MSAASPIGSDSHEFEVAGNGEKVAGFSRAMSDRLLEFLPIGLAEGQ
jgi:hypothetical protein